MTHKYFNISPDLKPYELTMGYLHMQSKEDYDYGSHEREQDRKFVQMQKQQKLLNKKGITKGTYSASKFRHRGTLPALFTNNKLAADYNIEGEANDLERQNES